MKFARMILIGLVMWVFPFLRPKPMFWSVLICFCKFSDSLRRNFSIKSLVFSSIDHTTHLGLSCANVSEEVKYSILAFLVLQLVIMDEIDMKLLFCVCDYLSQKRESSVPVCALRNLFGVDCYFKRRLSTNIAPSSLLHLFRWLCVAFIRTKDMYKQGKVRRTKTHFTTSWNKNKNTHRHHL